MQPEDLKKFLPDLPIKGIAETIDRTHIVELTDNRKFHIKDFMLRTIASRIDCSPETPWLVVQCGCTIRMEPITRVLYIPKGKAIGGVVTLSDGSEMGCVAVKWESGILEKSFIKDGRFIRRSGIPAWDAISDEYDLYRNPLNKKYWDTMPYLSCDHQYDGEDIFLLPQHEVAFMKVDNKWMPTSPSWLDRIKHTEFQMWKSIAQPIGAVY